MKRILSLILTVLLLPGFLAVPARADDFDSSSWLNLLDYGYPEGYATNYIDLSAYPSGSFNIKYVVPGAPYIYDYDVIFRTDSTDFKIGTIKEWMTVIDLGHGLYRAIGASDYRSGRTPLYFDFTDGTYLEILRFNVSTYDSYMYQKTVSGIVYHSGNEVLVQRPIIFPANPNSGLDNQVDLDNTGNTDIFFRSELVVSEWQSMDFIQLNLSSYCKSIDSISVQINGVSVPYELNHVDLNLRSGTDLVLIDLLLDVRNFRKVANHSIDIVVTGTVGADQKGNFYIQDCFGLVDLEPPSPWTVWFTKLSGWFTTQTNALLGGFNNTVAAISNWGQKIVDALGGSNDSSEVQDEISSAVGQLQQAGAALDAVQRPDLGQIDINVVGMVDPAGLTGVAAIASIFTGNELIYTIMVMFVTLALISYILFGK